MEVFTTVIYSLTYVSWMHFGSQGLPHGKISNPKLKNFLSVEKINNLMNFGGLVI